MGLHDVQVNELIEKTAEELKKIEHIQPPEWAKFVRTGNHKERQPARTDWWYIRAAAILRRIQLVGPIGVNKIRVQYGGKQNRGFKPEKFVKGSGNIARKILQQLEKAELAKQDAKGSHKGRVITPKGQSLLEKVSSEIMKVQGLVLPKKPVLPKEKFVKKRKKKTVKRKVTKKRKTAKKVEKPAEEKKTEDKAAEKEKKTTEVKAPVEKVEEKTSEVKAPEETIATPVEPTPEVKATKETKEETK